MNPKLGQLRASLDAGRETSQVNGQGQIVQSENYCYVSIRVAFIDEIEKKNIERVYEVRFGDDLSIMLFISNLRYFLSVIDFSGGESFLGMSFGKCL